MAGYPYPQRFAETLNIELSQTPSLIHRWIHQRLWFFSSESDHPSLTPQLRKWPISVRDLLLRIFSCWASEAERSPLPSLGGASASELQIHSRSWRAWAGGECGSHEDGNPPIGGTPRLELVVSNHVFFINKWHKSGVGDIITIWEPVTKWL